MNLDDFEQYLARKPLRKIPTEWQEEIVGRLLRLTQDGACESAFPSNLRRPERASASGRLHSWLRELFWPRRPVWATLAAIWLLILGLNLSSREKSSGTMAKAAPVSAEVIMEAREQRQQLMAELVQSFPMSVTPSETPKHSVLPGPRSEFQNQMGA